MISIAIDGPSSAGKSTMAKKIAEKLGYIYVDTGALYRSIGLYAVRMGADTKAQNEITPLLSNIKIDLKHIDGVQRILLNGEDVSEEIREPQMSMAASNVSAIGAVREFLLDMQKDIAKSNNIIMDGRDIGTVVLPKAQVKIFLTATADERAKRRYNEFISKGMDVKYENILADIIQRDYNDSNRPIAPLKKADDAIEFDTTKLNCQEVVDGLIKIIEEKIK
ncbi:MAG: (d)CMP kinase [Oscillospiraceae bacterium]